MLTPLALVLLLVRPAAASETAAAAVPDLCAPSKTAWESDELTRAVAENSHSDPCFQQEHRFVMKGFQPDGPDRPPACDDDAIWRQVRQAYIQALRSEAGNPVARSAANFLATSSVPLATKYMGDAYGTFDTTNPTINLDKALYEKLWSSLDGWSHFAEALEPLIEKTESPLVHEIAHARGFEARGDGYPFAEDELVAYGDQALYLLARLRRDPAYMDLAKIDAAMSQALGETAVFDARPWWTKPLPASVIERAKSLATEVRDRLQVTDYQTNDWFLVRSMAGGLEAFEANARAAGTVWGESAFADHRALAKKGAGPREHDDLPVMIACRAKASDEGYERYLAREIALVKRRRASWYTPESFRRQEAYYRGELDRQRRQWTETQPPQ